MAQAHFRANERQVQVTLLKPFGESGELTVTYGSTDAVPRGQIQGTVAMGDNLDLVNTNSQYGTVYNANANWVPGEPIRYGPMVAGDPDMQSCLMPESVAKSVFGDWGLPASAEYAPNPRLTRAFEKDRIAMRWGDYKHKDQVMLHYEKKSRDTVRIGPPDVPHVRIERVDSRGKVIPGWSYEPWEFFGWARDAYAPATLTQAQAPQVQIIDTAALRAQIISELKDMPIVAAPKRPRGRPRKIEVPS